MKQNMILVLSRHKRCLQARSGRIPKSNLNKATTVYNELRFLDQESRPRSTHVQNADEQFYDAELGLFNLITKFIHVPDTEEQSQENRTMLFI